MNIVHVDYIELLLSNVIRNDSSRKETRYDTQTILTRVAKQALDEVTLIVQ
jgi:hypothetical protein